MEEQSSDEGAQGADMPIAHMQLVAAITVWTLERKVILECC